MDASRDNNFDFTRLALAVAVILSHSYVLTGQTEKTDFVHAWTGIEAGVFAVNGFFAISGYLIAASWLRSRSTFSYLRKRVYRIYPGFIVAFVVGLWVVAPLSAEVLRYDSWLKLVSAMVLLKNVNPAGAFAQNPYPEIVNGSLWTIAYEFRCYLLVLVLGLAGLLARRNLLLVLALLASLVHALHHVVPLPQPDGAMAAIFGLPHRTARLLAYFFVGAALYVGQVPLRGKPAAGAVVVGALSLLYPPISHVVLPFAFTYVLLWFCTTSAIRLRGWARFGDFSYGTYLYAFPLQQLLVLWTHNSLSPLQHFALATTGSLLAGALSWHLIERHFVQPRKARQTATVTLPDIVATAAAAVAQPTPARADLSTSSLPAPGRE